MRNLVITLLLPLVAAQIIVRNDFTLRGTCNGPSTSTYAYTPMCEIGTTRTLCMNDSVVFTQPGPCTSTPANIVSLSLASNGSAVRATFSRDSNNCFAYTYSPASTDGGVPIFLQAKCNAILPLSSCSQNSLVLNFAWTSTAPVGCVASPPPPSFALPPPAPTTIGTTSETALPPFPPGLPPSPPFPPSPPPINYDLSPPPPTAPSPSPPPLFYNVFAVYDLAAQLEAESRSGGVLSQPPPPPPNPNPPPSYEKSSVTAQAACDLQSALCSVCEGAFQPANCVCSCPLSQTEAIVVGFVTVSLLLLSFFI